MPKQRFERIIQLPHSFPLANPKIGTTPESALIWSTNYYSAVKEHCSTNEFLLSENTFHIKAKKKCTNA